MAYQLIQLAPGSYDFLLEGEIIGSIVRSGYCSTDTTWTAELLDNDPAKKRPAPFAQVDHTFKTLEEICAWLGGPEIKPLR